jgi:hypothetical protein
MEPANDQTEPFPPPPQFLHGKLLEWDRALSLTPPWHWAILHMGKRVENRQRWKGCSYRGPIWLHAAKGLGLRDEFSETVAGIRRILQVQNDPAGQRVFDAMAAAGQVVRREHEWVPGPKLARGAIVGRAWISAVIDQNVDNHGLRYLDAVGPPSHRRLFTEAEQRWWFGGFALWLDRVEVLAEPVICPGAQMIYRVTPEVATACLRQLPPVVPVADLSPVGRSV